MVRVIHQLSHPRNLSKRQTATSNYSCDIPNLGLPQSSPRLVIIAGKKLRVSTVLNTFFYFVAERHKIHQRRIQGKPAPWTKDRILTCWPFTNVFRVYDRISQFILRHVIQEGDESLWECFFRVVLFRTFNRIGTWMMLKSALGRLTWQDFDIEAYERVLLAAEGPLYGAAYIMPGAKLGARTNASNDLRLIQLMMEEDAPTVLSKLNHLKDAHGYLCLYPSMGDFTSMQYIYSHICYLWTQANILWESVVGFCLTSI